MTDTNRSLQELPALLTERRKYEKWLQALDARRDTTPQHVFERVKADYTGRLERVDEELAVHRQAVNEERSSLHSRRSLLEAEEQLRRDERAELELRQHVGELEGGEADSAFKAVDDALKQLVGEKTGLSARIGELDALLELKPFATPPGQPSTPLESPPLGLPKMPAPALAPAPAAAPPRAAAPISPPPPPAPPRPAPVHAPAAAPPAPAVAAVSAAAKTERAEPIIPSTEPAPPDRGQLRTPDGRFDEMAFVRGVVGPEGNGPAASATAPAPPRARDVGSANVPLRGRASQEQLVESVRIDPTRVERPLAANVPSNTPIVLRTSGQTEQSKTLKCSECGAMNYPTEWYCERCGAELAAL
ncbi:MAG TPA: Ran-binding zinc finger domain-containing protein [Gemmatimonadaceae bacterium]|nr:Ran-binding zinc finger domain-containing protein [Gemmatimonadaceae bacterium]